MAIIQKIQPHLWIKDQAEEAVKFYTSIFKNSEIGNIMRYTKEGFEYHHMPEGRVLTIEFKIEGQSFIALNGGAVFQFSEAISFVIFCDSQQEVDFFWDKLIADGGKENMCGWLTDKFGLSWQVIPIEFHEMLRDPDPEKVRRVTHAMFNMRKLDVDELRNAFNNKNYTVNKKSEF